MGFSGQPQVPVGEANVNIRRSIASAKQNKVLAEALKKQRQRQINSAFSVVLDMDAFPPGPGGTGSRWLRGGSHEHELKTVPGSIAKSV